MTEKTLVERLDDAIGPDLFPRAPAPTINALLREARAALSWRSSEEWRPFDEFYQVSNYGRVRRGGVVIGQWQSDQGYMRVRLADPRRIVQVHRMVAQAFVENPENKPGVNHLNSDRSFNCAWNLEWCTQAENLEHAAAAGRLYKQRKGLRSPFAILNDQQVRELRRLRHEMGKTYKEIGALIGLSPNACARAAKGETYADVLPLPPAPTKPEGAL